MKNVRNTKKRLERPVELDKINPETRVQDVAWVCSLSESEMDFLISLKLLITQRAERIGCKNLADRFDLKTIRAIAFVLMENLKAELKDTSTIPDTMESTTFLDACNILNCNNEVSATIEELSTTVGADIQPILRRYLPLPNCNVCGNELNK
ncbi:Spc97/Spc98 family of spindle pole body (SBP) component [Trifolium pratense]|uniref:Spc97/Spc98 family of spindle pole body (SBP) component n=1 Tax=Trifolium pratense TaxID=57577 RepID=A0A2K3MUW2_TRIPR|nr:Spc97/Spc98 family of spindle pole body (SBP) component [Trifolium pratense]